MRRLALAVLTLLSLAACASREKTDPKAERPGFAASARP
jgi:hypothetical protein